MPRTTLDQLPWSIWLTGVGLMALAAAAPLLLNTGFLNTRQAGDSPFLLFRLHQLYTALGDGLFPVRWMPDGAFGLGYPFFHYYAALPYYLAAGLHGLGASYVLSLKLTVLAGFLAAGWGMWGWLQAITGRQAAALLAAAAYTFAPYHLVNVYLRGDSLAEFWAMAWFPIILWAVYRAARRPTRRNLAAVALAYSALMLTHNISALIFSPFVALYALACLLAGARASSTGAVLRRAGRLIAAGLLGLALAAWFWVPALREQDAAQLSEQTTGYFFYGGHFRDYNLVQPTLAFNYDVLSEQANPFSMGLVQACLICVGAVGLVVRLGRARVWSREGFILAGLALSTWMITSRSETVWANVPLLAYAQFPWRFLSIQALFGAAVIGTLADLPVRWGRGQAWSAGIALVAGGLMIAAAGSSLNPDFVPITDADVTAQRLNWYEAFSGNIGTTIRHEYLPAWTRPRPYTSDMLLQRPPRAKFLAGEGTARRDAVQAASQTWEIEVSGSGAQVALPLLYWPGWKAAVDGVTVPIGPLEGPGYIRLNVPGGQHTVRLWLARTPLRFGMEALSLGALLVVVALLRPRPDRWRWRVIIVAGGALIACAALVQLWPEPKPSSTLVNADFAHYVYFHAAPEGLDFDRAAHLADAVFRVRDGLFSYAVQWRSVGDRLFTLALAPQPQQMFLNVPLYPVEDQGSAASGEMTGNFLLASVSPGLYFPRLMVFEPGADSSDPANSLSARTANGYGRAPLHLAPIVVSPGQYVVPGDVAPVDAEIGPLRLRGAATAAAQDRLTITLWWETLGEVPVNYGVDISLYDLNGYEWVRFNAIAGGGGLYPTALWSPGEIVPDAYQIDIPAGMPPGIYRLRVALYDPVIPQTVGQVEFSGLRQPTVAAYPCTSQPVYTFETLGLGLGSLKVSGPVLQGDPLPVEMGWVAARAPRQNYRLLWALGGPDEIVWRTVTALAPGSDSRAWLPPSTCGAWVLAHHQLAVPDSIPPGEYALAFQLLNEAGQPLAEPIQVGSVTLVGRSRVFDVPELDVLIKAIFDDTTTTITLWGYNWQQTADRFMLDLAWGALTDPDADYKYFVHLYRVGDLSAVVDQVDRVPRDFTYPTSLWLAGEVVEDTVTFDLAGLVPGEYAVAVGWYNPVDFTRLPVISTEGGEILPDHRLILPDRLTVP